jgi:transposase
VKHSTPNLAPVTTNLLSLDLGDRDSRYFVIDEAGAPVGEGSVRTTREALDALFARFSPREVALEVGGHSPWVSRLAESRGIRATVANARKLALITRNERKNDRTDAELLARLARVDRKLLCPVRHRSEQSQKDLAILRARSELVATRTALINHVRGQVKSLGKRLTSCSSECFHKRVVEQLPVELQPALLPVVQMIEHATATIRGMEERIEAIAAERYPSNAQLQQVGGVGTQVALSFMLTIDDPARMKNSRQAGAFVGLTPRTRESGDSSPQLRITKAGDRETRRLLVISANYILGRFGPDCDLRRFGLKIAARGGKNARKRAKVAVARKLAVLLHHLWKTGEVYDPFHNARRRGEPVPA